MLSLRDAQSAFAQALAGSTETITRLSIRADGFAAYRDSVQGRLINALQASFPVVEALVGEPFFREAARQYAAANPCHSGDLNEYGGSFNEFLTRYPHARSLPYLPDVARLEWLIQTVCNAANAPTPDLTALATCPPEAFHELYLQCTPALAKLDSRWPVDQIWLAHQEDPPSFDTVNFSQNARLLIVRQGYRVRLLSQGAAEACFIDCVQAGRSLVEALADAQTCLQDESETGSKANAPSFDLLSALQRLITEGVLVGAVRRS